MVREGAVSTPAAAIAPDVSPRRPAVVSQFAIQAPGRPGPALCPACETLGMVKPKRPRDPAQLAKLIGDVERQNLTMWMSIRAWSLEEIAGLAE